MSSTNKRMESEESCSSPPAAPSASPDAPPLSKEENSSSFKLSIKRGKSESGAVILTSEIINSSSTAESLKEEIKREDEEEEAMAESSAVLSSSRNFSSVSSTHASPLVIEVFKKEGPKVETTKNAAVSGGVEQSGGANNAAALGAVVRKSGADSAVSGVSSEPLWMVGDVVWCLQRGNPWWPCLVTNEFNSDEHSRYVNSGSRTIKQYHVQFFGPKPLHAWIHENSVRPFEHRNEVAGWKERDVAVFKKMSKPRREKAMKAYQPTSKAIIIELDAAKDEAEKALGMPVIERLDVFEFEYQSVGENSSEMTSDKRKVKFTPLKPGTTVVMMSAEGGGRVDPPEVKSESTPPPPSASKPADDASASASETVFDSTTASASVSASASIPSDLTSSPPSKRRRTIAPSHNENGLSTSSSFAVNSVINNNNIKIDNNNLLVVEGNAAKPAPIRYPMMNAMGGGGVAAASPSAKVTPEKKISSVGDLSGIPPPPPSSSSSSSSSPDRIKDAAEHDGGGDECDADDEERDVRDDGDEANDDDEEEAASPKDNPDIFSKFSLCHAAEMKSIHPELSTETIESKLREQWDSMSDEEANWYIYNGVPPGKLLPGKKRLRPKSKFLERLFEEHDRRKNGLTA